MLASHKGASPQPKGMPSWQEVGPPLPLMYKHIAAAP